MSIPLPRVSMTYPLSLCIKNIVLRIFDSYREEKKSNPTRSELHSYPNHARSILFRRSSRILTNSFLLYEIRALRAHSRSGKGGFSAPFSSKGLLCILLNILRQCEWQNIPADSRVFIRQFRNERNTRQYLDFWHGMCLKYYRFAD